LKKLIIKKSLNFLSPYICNTLVRVGNKGDGGYLIPKILIDKTRCLISLGISDDWSFDEHFSLLNPNLKIHAYDHTISENSFRRNIKNILLNMLILRFSWKKLKKALASYYAYKAFFKGNTKHFQKRIFNRIEKLYDITLDEVIKKSNSNQIFLKIDIEGGEYRIIDSIIKNSDKILGLAIEFHDTDPLRKVFLDSVRKIQTKFKIVHFHANNFAGYGKDFLPESPEITFINKKIKLSVGQRRRSLPISRLDFKNCSEKQDYSISFSI